MNDTQQFQTVTEIPEDGRHKTGGRPTPERYQKMMDHLDAHPGEIIVVTREEGGSALYQWFRKHRPNEYKVITRNKCFYLAKLESSDAAPEGA